MSGEVSIYCSQVIIYVLDENEDGEWHALGNSEWCELHLFRESAIPVNNYRFVAWIPGKNEVLVNSNLEPISEYSKTSTDFLEFTNPNELIYGFHFAREEDVDVLINKIDHIIPDLQVLLQGIEPVSVGEGIPDDFIPPPAPLPPKDKVHPVTGKPLMKRRSLAAFDVVNEAVESYNSNHDLNNESYEDVVGKIARRMSSNMMINNEKKVDNVDNVGELSNIPKPETSHLAAPPPPTNVFEDSKNNQQQQEEQKQQKTNLPSPPQPPQNKGVSLPSDLVGDGNLKGHDSISVPARVHHDLHIVYNEYTARFEGLPESWKHMNVQFGVDLVKVPKTKVEGYTARIPAVLVMMKRYLFENNAKDVVGIFRLAPDKDDCNFVKDQINQGTFESCNDVNIIANLIKVWFRDLPVSLFDVISDEDIYRLAEMDVPLIHDELEKIVQDPHKSLIYWLLDTMAAIVIHEKVNKMSAKNMAIVMSPNLFSVSSDNPMAALTMSQKIADFTTRILASRLLTHWDYECVLG